MIKCKHDIHTCPDTVRLSKELTEHEQFMTFLNIFLCHGDQEALNSSILLASSNTEIEMIRALQNSNTLTSIDNLPPAILYFLGKESNNSHYINIAAEGFKRESNFRGQADALWLLAKQEMSNGNLTSAMNYGLESARILKAINEDSLASIVEFWIEQNTQ